MDTSSNLVILGVILAVVTVLVLVLGLALWFTSRTK